MGVFKVLQLCLLAFSIGAEAGFEWSASDTKDTDEEPHSMQQPPSFETAYEALHQAEAPEFGLEVKHQDPQDFDIMLMTHRVRRSEEKKKKKKKRPRVGTYTALGTHRVRRSEEKKNKKRKKTRVGAYAPLGSIFPPDVKRAPDVVRAKRQL